MVLMLVYIKNASIHLEQDIQSQGINQVIGINLNID